MLNREVHTKTVAPLLQWAWRGEPHIPWRSEEDSWRDSGVRTATVPCAGFGGPSDHPQQSQADKPQPPTHFFGPHPGICTDKKQSPGFPGSPPDEKGSPKQTSIRGAGNKRKVFKTLSATEKRETWSKRQALEIKDMNVQV